MEEIRFENIETELQECIKNFYLCQLILPIYSLNGDLREKKWRAIFEECKKNLLQKGFNFISRKKEDNPVDNFINITKIQHIAVKDGKIYYPPNNIHNYSRCFLQ